MGHCGAPFGTIIGVLVSIYPTTVMRVVLTITTARGP